MLVGVLVLAAAAAVDAYARKAHLSEVRALTTSHADAVATRLRDVFAREAGAVETLAAFVVATEGDAYHLEDEFDQFADALLGRSESHQSLQLAPGGVLSYIHPIEGNEAAIGLDLMQLESRRDAILGAAASGSVVIEGPIELVQGGTGVLIRKPVVVDGELWGVASVLLDWSALLEETGLGLFENEMTAIRVHGSPATIAGSGLVFTKDPAISRVAIEGTNTVWEVGVSPIGGWPRWAPHSMPIWIAGLAIALLAGVVTWFAMRRPEVHRRARERALADLAVVEARFTATVRHAGVGIVLTELDGTIITANDAFRQIAEIAPSTSLSGIDVRELVHPDDLEAHRAAMRRLRDTGEAVEVDVRTASGDRWTRLRVTTFHQPGSQETTFIGVVEDITERRLERQKLQESEQRYRELFHHTPVPVQIEDFTDLVTGLEALRASGVDDLRMHLAVNPRVMRELYGSVRIVDMNPAAEELSEEVGMADGDWRIAHKLTPVTREALVGLLDALWNDRTLFQAPVESGPGDAHALVLRVRVPEVDGRQDHENVIVTLMDVTELRDAQRRLEDLIESKDRFLASVAHELRTPLTAVVGFADELTRNRDSYSSAEREEFEKLIAFHGNELGLLVEDLLVWARADIGEVRLDVKQIDVSEVVQQTLSFVPEMAGRFGSGGPVFGWADEVRVRQIIRNLVTNAMKHGGDDVRIDVAAVEGRIHVEVSDDGDEITPDAVKRMFEPYGRAETLVVGPGSIGLGLTVSRSLARLQGGDLVYRRVADRNVFRLELPGAHSRSQPVGANL